MNVAQETIAPQTIEGVTGLRRIDPVRADITNLLIRLLDGGTLYIGDVAHPVTASGGTAIATSHNPWFATDGHIWFRVVRGGGAAVVYDEARLTDTIRAIDSVDPLLHHVEALLGISLEPAALSNAVDDDAIQISIATQTDHIIIAVTPGALNLPHMTAASHAALPAFADMPCIAQMQVTAADLPIDDAADLDHGDIIIIGRRAAGRLSWPGGSHDGTVDFTQGLFYPASHSGDDMTATTSRPGGFSVPVAISLPALTTSVETLAALKPGATLPLGPITDGLRVTVTVGGRPLAGGEIVQIGDQFAVLIETRLDVSEPVEDTAITQPADEG
jgi:hypothetical protein